MPSVSLSSENVVPEKARVVATGEAPPEVSVKMVVAAASCPVTWGREQHIRAMLDNFKGVKDLKN